MTRQCARLTLSTNTFRWEAVETVKAQELAAMTDERARQITQSLGAVEGWWERPDRSGLVEQQAMRTNKGLLI
jgi:hypothetical protein